MITLAAAVVVTVIRFVNPDAAIKNKIGLLALFYMGASVMWCVDGFASLAEGETFIEISDKAAMADDALLGIWVVLLGLAFWAICRVVTYAITKSRA
jgi:uncharacterized membrane protein